MAIETRIGEVELNLGEYHTHKFIVVREGDCLVYHARAMISEKESSHKDIADSLKLEDSAVTGGGFADFPSDEIPPLTLKIGGKSGNYDGIPNEIMKLFEYSLIEVYRRISQTIVRVDINTDCSLSLQDWWRLYGLNSPLIR